MTFIYNLSKKKKKDFYFIWIILVCVKMCKLILM